MIVDRYIAREILFTLFAVLAVLLVIFSSNRFIRYLADVTGGELDGAVVFTILGLKTLGALVIILPLGLFMAVLLAFSRLYKDSEMTALAACGVTIARIYRPVVVLALLVAAVVAGISFYAAPWAEERAYQIQDEQRARAALAGAPPGQFTQFSGRRGVFYFEGLGPEDGTMHRIFARLAQDAGEIVLTAERGFSRVDADGAHYLVFEDGVRYEGAPGAANFRIIEFAEHSVRLEPVDVRPASRKQRAIPTAALVRSDRLEDAAELQWRASTPLSVIVLALLAVPLSRTNPRQGKYARLFVAVLIYLVYNNVLGMATSWVGRGSVPVWLGVWWVHVLMLAAAWGLFARQYGLAWTLGRMRAGRAA